MSFRSDREGLDGFCDPVGALGTAVEQVLDLDPVAMPIAGLSWKTGKKRADLRRTVRHAELCELLPETGAAWRDGKITTTAVDMIAAGRVPTCDEELAAVEPELLERAMRGDHKRLKVLTD